MSSTRTIAVVGATGHQGSGAVAALLSSPAFAVRALTTNPAGPKAEALVSQHDTYVTEGRLEVVQADLNDRESLEKALKGCYGVFAAMTVAPNEVEQGKTLVDVAKAEGVEHFIYSSLPSIAKASGGKFTNVKAFDNKAEIEQYAKEKLDNLTVLIPGAFYSNLHLAIYARRGDDGTAVFPLIGLKDYCFGWLDDGKDVGTFAAAAFSKGPSVTAGKTYPVESRPCTIKELAAEYESLTGERATCQPTEIDVALAGFPDFLKPSIKEVFQYVAEVRPGSICHGTMEPEDDKSFEDLGVKASSLKDFIERTGFRIGGGGGN